MGGEVLQDDVIRARLASDLPVWSYDGAALVRVYRTTGWKSALILVNTIGHLAEAAWHHPDLQVSYGSVAVRLSTHDAGGVTDKDFALAKKIEEVVTWRPAPGDALEDAPAEHKILRD